MQNVQEDNEEIATTLIDNYLYSTKIIMRL